MQLHLTIITTINLAKPRSSKVLFLSLNYALKGWRKTAQHRVEKEAAEALLKSRISALTFA